MNTPVADTRERLLDAAEALFAEHGFEGASLRAITSRARTNLAAANYHFRSKEALLDAVIDRRIGPVNAERLERLDELEGATGRAVELEELLEAFVGPALRLASDPRGGATFMRLVGRMLAESGELWQRFIARMLPIRERFAAALARALPDLPRAELAWRMHFTAGAMVGTMSDHCRLREISGGLCDPEDAQGTIRRIVPFLAAGMRARMTAERGAAERRGRGRRGAGKARP
jgi:AcrR family transcriptional regulator